MECDCKKHQEGFAPKVVIPEQKCCPVMFRLVKISASMGDDTVIKPENGLYRNVILNYEANNHTYLYSSDGVPTRLNNGMTNYDEATNLPKINSVTLIGNKTSADLRLADAPKIITIKSGNTSWEGADSAEDVYNFFVNRGKVSIIFEGSENNGYQLITAAYIEDEQKLMGVVVAASTDHFETTEFNGDALLGVMTLYTENKAVDVGEIDLQPRLFIADFTGLSLDGNELSGVPATATSIGMVKPGDGLEIDSSGVISVDPSETQSDWDENDNTEIAYIKNKPIISNSNYSTSELPTNTVWVDNEPIYKKTIDIGALPDTDTKTVAHEVTSLSMLVKIEGCFYNGTNSAPLPYPSPTSTKNVQIYVDNTNINIITGEDRTDYNGYVTIYYTKNS